MEEKYKDTTEEVVSNEKKLQQENAQLKMLLNNMRQQMEQMNMVNLLKRMELLFKVIEFKESFSSDFVIACSEEIEHNMTLDEEIEDKEE